MRTDVTYTSDSGILSSSECLDDPVRGKVCHCKNTSTACRHSISEISGITYNDVSYLIAIFNEYFDFLVIKIAHAYAFYLVIHLSVHP